MVQVKASISGKLVTITGVSLQTELSGEPSTSPMHYHECALMEELDTVVRYAWLKLHCAKGT